MRLSEGDKSISLRRREIDQTGVSTSTITCAFCGALPCSRTLDQNRPCQNLPGSAAVCDVGCTLRAQSSPLASWSYAHPGAALPRSVCRRLQDSLPCVDYYTFECVKQDRTLLPAKQEPGASPARSLREKWEGHGFSRAASVP